MKAALPRSKFISSLRALVAMSFLIAKCGTSIPSPTVSSSAWTSRKARRARTQPRLQHSPDTNLREDFPLLVATRRGRRKDFFGRFVDFGPAVRLYRERAGNHPARKCSPGDTLCENLQIACRFPATPFD